MSYSIKFDDGSGSLDVFSLATTHGLKLLGDWVGTLPPGESRSLRTLIDSGACPDSAALSAELAAALRDHVPDDPDVESTAQNLITLMGVGDPGESASVVDDADLD